MKEQVSLISEYHLQAEKDVQSEREIALREYCLDLAKFLKPQEGVFCTIEEVIESARTFEKYIKKG